jgi:hypothetical protein
MIVGVGKTTSYGLIKKKYQGEEEQQNFVLYFIIKKT